MSIQLYGSTRSVVPGSRTAKGFVPALGQAGLILRQNTAGLLTITGPKSRSLNIDGLLRSSLRISETGTADLPALDCAHWKWLAM